MINWRKIQNNNFKNLTRLADFLELNAKQRNKLLKKPHFSLNLPQRLAEKIEKRTLNDPLLRQFLPLDDELVKSESLYEDPVDDKSFQITPKLLKKYEGRVLLLTTGACAMHCRFCFRQNYSYEFNANFQEEITKIQEDPSLFEVILSGGDPLSLNDEILHHLLREISKIPHIKIIRFHSRFPIGIPERITDNFLNLFDNLSKQIIFVLHCNHPKELDKDVIESLKRLQKRGITLLNQAVLLKGVNDDIETLTSLCKILIAEGIIPYYLHQLDPIQGAGHFKVDIEKGIALIEQLREKIPGYAVPQFVQEQPYKRSKTVLEIKKEP